MFSNPAIDIAIGLIFIYLLYSLLASIVQEIIANMTQLRGQMLEYAICRMLEDGEGNYKAWYSSTLSRMVKTWIIDPLNWTFGGLIKAVARIMGKHKAPTARDHFYNMPSIKYLREGSFFNRPSYIGAETFSQTLINMLLGGGQPAAENRIAIIRTHLEQKAPVNLNIGDATYEFTLSPETRQHIINLLNEAQGDYERFKANLEHWFNTTMDRLTGWYKRKVQGILLVIGLALAIIFNIDTIEIATRLHNDPEMRKQLVTLAQDYRKYATVIDSLRHHPNNTTDTAGMAAKQKEYLKRYEELIDSAKSFTTHDLSKVNAALGLGRIHDTCWKYRENGKWISVHDTDAEFLVLIEKRLALARANRLKDSIYHQFYTVHGTALRDSLKNAIVALTGQIRKDRNNIDYNAYSQLPQGNHPRTWLGWLITALAISLGAPFWFDLLSKFMQLRGSGNKPEDSATAKNTNYNATPKRVG